jgi:hypothetical protein
MTPHLNETRTQNSHYYTLKHIFLTPLILGHLSKTAVSRFSYNKQNNITSNSLIMKNITYTNFSAIRLFQTIAIYRWCSEVSWSIFSFPCKYVGMRSSHAFILLSSVNSHQLWELPILPILIFNSNLKWKINILKKTCLAFLKFLNI